MCGPQHHSAKEKQHGAALMVMLVIMVMGGAAFLVSSLSTTALKTARQEKTAEALAKAKEALIGYAASDTNRPGNLPCPDVDNDGQLTMNVDYSGSNCVSPVGRLPWKTLGLPDLRDSTGERLWYAVSKAFWSTQASSINSDTLGNLTVTGTTTSSNVIAIVFAPGNALSGQSRSSTQTACSTTNSTIAENLCATNYLEGTNDDINLPATPNTAYQTATASDTFNDQMLLINHDALFSTTEKIVGKRTANMLSSHLSTYWGTSLYPYAGTFENPSTSFFTPASGNTNGLLPSTAVWAAIPGYSLLLQPGEGATVLCSLSNGINSLVNARARCDISGVVGTPAITITGTLNYLGLWRKYDLNNSSEARVKYNGINVGAATVPGMNATLTYTINADSSVTVTFTGNIVAGVTRIELRDVVVDSTYGWFTNNKWQQVMYYAVSPGYVPGGGNACAPLPGTPSCLKLNGSSGGDDKRAVVVMTGSVLTEQSRSSSPLALCAATGTILAPSACISNYLELENATPANFIYENKTRSSSFNDWVTVVAP